MTQCKTYLKQNENSEYSSEIQFLLKSLRSIIILSLLKKKFLTKTEIAYEIQTVFLTEPDASIIDDLLDELWFEDIIFSEYSGTQIKYSLTPRGSRKSNILRNKAVKLKNNKTTLNLFSIVWPLLSKCCKNEPKNKR